MLRYERHGSAADFNLRAEPHHVLALSGMDVAAIDTPDILRAIEPHWTTRTTTADRVRNRIAQVIDWSVVRGHRPPGTNPAAWKGHLDQVLPPVRKVAPVAHHAALDYHELPAFMVELRRRAGTSARALEFLILTAATPKPATAAGPPPKRRHA